MEYPKFNFKPNTYNEIYVVLEINKATNNINPVVACWSYTDAKRHLELFNQDTEYLDRQIVGPVKLESKHDFFTPGFIPSVPPGPYLDPDMFPRPTGPPNIPTMTPPDFMKPVKPQNPPNPPGFNPPSF
jgi:hypothetical protein